MFYFLNSGLFDSTEEGGNGWVIWVIMGVLLVGMVVMTIIPQRKQKKKTESMMNSLAAGDKIMTIGGFVGTIVEINSYNDQITINVGSEEAPVNVVIVKNAIRNKMDSQPIAQPAPAPAPVKEEVKDTKTDIQKAVEAKEAEEVKEEETPSDDTNDIKF